MKILFFILSVVLTLPSYSVDEKADTFLVNLTLLDQKILDTEKAISILQGRNSEAVSKLESLKEMLVLVKSRFQVINYSTSIFDQIKLAQDNGWKNIAKYLIDTSETCQGFNNLKDDCLLKVAGIKEFVIGRKISKKSKEEFLIFSDNYLSFLESKIEINEKFIENLDFNLKETQKYFSFKSLPLVTVKIHKVPPVKHPSVKDNVEQLNPELLVEKRIVFSSFLIGILVLILSVLFYVYLKKEKHMKKMKQFYTKVYFSGKKNNLELKIFGNIEPVDLIKLKKVELAFIDALVSSGTFANKAILRFKSNHNELIVETIFEDIGSIQSKLGAIDSEAFTSGLSRLQLKVQALGGELFFVNLFNEKGENNSTSYSVLIPTV
jgi:hypothetical protein